MKVKLVSQLISQSIADDFKFYKENLKMNELSDACATIKIIEIFNIAFEILNMG